MHKLPAPVPVTEYVDTLWRAVEAGALSWEDVRSLQAQTMPKCAAHDRPAAIRLHGAPLCEQCVKEGRHRI